MENKSIKKMNKIGGFKDMTSGIIITSLFALAIITFAFQVALDNSATSILSDPSLQNANDTLSNELGNLQDTAQAQRESFEQQQAIGSSSDEGFSLTAIVGNVKNFFSATVSSFNILFIVISDTIGIPPIVLNLITGIIIIIMLLLFWRIIKAGGT